MSDVLDAVKVADIIRNAREGLNVVHPDGGRTNVLAMHADDVRALLTAAEQSAEAVARAERLQAELNASREREGLPGLVRIIGEFRAEVREFSRSKIAGLGREEIAQKLYARLDRDAPCAPWASVRAIGGWETFLSRYYEAADALIALTPNPKAEQGGAS